MAYRRFRNSKPTVRVITVKYAGKCACCGGTIQPGQLADFYPVGTIAGVRESKIAHLKAMDGNSLACSDELKKQRDTVRDPGEDAADRWAESQNGI